MVMASLGDAAKRQAWVAKFARYQASGLSVARFCKQERVSANTFYYWAKRLKTASTALRARRAVSSRRAAAEPTSDSSTREAVVRFRCASGAEVVVPANCLETIRCLAECLTEAGRHRGEAFQEVVVKA
jgi:hypothetical protein